MLCLVCASECTSICLPAVCRSRRVGAGELGGGWQPGLCNQRPEPGERTEEGAALISANYMYPVHLVGHR